MQRVGKRAERFGRERLAAGIRHDTRRRHYFPCLLPRYAKGVDEIVFQRLAPACERAAHGCAIRLFALHRKSALRKIHPDHG